MQNKGNAIEEIKLRSMHFLETFMVPLISPDYEMVRCFGLIVRLVRFRLRVWRGRPIFGYL